MSLVHHGSNGGVSGNYVSVLFKTYYTVDIKAIDNHHHTDVPIGTVSGFCINTKRLCYCHYAPI
jgi:hypothetical protein